MLIYFYIYCIYINLWEKVTSRCYVVVFVLMFYVGVPFGSELRFLLLLHHLVFLLCFSMIFLSLLVKVSVLLFQINTSFLLVSVKCRLTYAKYIDVSCHFKHRNMDTPVCDSFQSFDILTSYF